MSEATQILTAFEDGNVQTAETLLPLVYDELRRLAAQKLAQERPGQTLQATALVHEAYLRLIGAHQTQPFASRRHFFGAAAEAMRRILVENARRKRRLRRGGGSCRVELEEAQWTVASPIEDMVALDEALERLAQTDPQAAEVVKLHYFAGLTVEQAAEALQISCRTAYRDWAYARAWLYRWLNG